MVFLTDSSSPYLGEWCVGLFVVRSRRNGITNRREAPLMPFSSTAPVRGGSTGFSRRNLDQEGTRYGN